jgi:hypothetical protein
VKISWSLSSSKYWFNEFTFPVLNCLVLQTFVRQILPVEQRNAIVVAEVDIMGRNAK